MNQVVIIFALLSVVDCTFMVKREKDNLIGVKNRTDGSLTLKWNLFNFNSESGYKIDLFYNKVEKKNNFVQVTFDNNENLPLSILAGITIAAVPFKDGVNGNINVTNGNGTFILQLSNLQFDDKGVIILMAYVFGTGLNQAFSKNITFSVEGGPFTCQESNIPQNFTCEVGNQIKGNITLCGKPQPEVAWSIGENAFNGSVDESMKSKHQYTYSFNEKVTSDMCGQDLSYKATGFTSQNEIVSKVLLKKFNIRNAVFKQTKGGCPLLTWEAEYHGLCEVDMFLSFLRNDNSTMNVTIPVRNQTFQDCRITMNSTAVYYKTVVYMINEIGNRVKISEDDNNFNKTIVHNVELKPTTTTTTTRRQTTTTPTTTPPRSFWDVRGDKLNVPLVLGAVVSFTVNLALMILFCWCVKKKREEDRAYEREMAESSSIPMIDLPRNQRPRNVDIEGRKAKVKKKDNKSKTKKKRPLPTPCNAVYDELSNIPGPSRRSPEELAALYAQVTKKPKDDSSIYSEVYVDGGIVRTRPAGKPSNSAEAKDLFNEYSNLEDEENKKDEASSRGYRSGKEPMRRYRPLPTTPVYEDPSNIPGPSRLCPDEIRALYAEVKKKKAPDSSSIYSEVGVNGGRVGLKPNIEPSNYAEPKDSLNEYSNLEDEENKKGEASANGFVGEKKT